MFGEKRLRGIAERVLAVSEADETEVVVFGLEERLTRFANNAIHQNVAETNAAAVIRVALGRRVGVATTNDLSDVGLERAVERATAAARLSPEDPDYPGLPEPTSVGPVEAFDERTAGYTPADRARDVGAVCRRAEERGVIASGAFRTAVHEFAVANSHGLFAYHPTTVADLTTVAMTEDSAGYAAGAAWKVEEVDVVGLGMEAIERALRGRNPQPLKPGVYPVVLGPHAVADIVAFITQMAGAMLVAEGRSWMTGRQGERLMSSGVSIWDDGRDPGGWPLPFDFEGMPRQRVDIVREGVVGEPVYDRRWARKEGKASTGHALPLLNPLSPWLSGGAAGPLPLHPVMGPGEHTVEEMVASVSRGLYVTRFHYTRVVHPRDAVITGMTRDGTFLIEDGEITTPVKNLRFTQSYVEALAEVEMVGCDLCRVRTGLGILRAPALKLPAFHFTGATTF
ncbi:MAG TPA: TldD/PmbA family protein [Thermoflexia bacterium]|jgi:predicted Zn-dependent protease|nr:TldD/PmbA family protein [Thermoflexia bacterium]